MKNGLRDKDGVIFLDEYDRKMILVRAGMKVMRLDQCGIAMEKRFSFYDQVVSARDHSPAFSSVWGLPGRFLSQDSGAG